MKLVLEKACSVRGADMGRPNVLPEDRNNPIKLQMIKLEWVDWDYDSGGAYWGNSGGTSIYCAFNGPVRVFVRATDRKEAKAKVRLGLPNAIFFV